MKLQLSQEIDPAQFEETWVDIEPQEFVKELMARSAAKHILPFIETEVYDAEYPVQIVAKVHVLKDSQVQLIKRLLNPLKNSEHRLLAIEILSQFE